MKKISLVLIGLVGCSFTSCEMDELYRNCSNRCCYTSGNDYMGQPDVYCTAERGHRCDCTCETGCNGIHNPYFNGIGECIPISYDNFYQCDYTRVVIESDERPLTGFDEAILRPSYFYFTVSENNNNEIRGKFCASLEFNRYSDFVYIKNRQEITVDGKVYPFIIQGNSIELNGRTYLPIIRDKESALEQLFRKGFSFVIEDIFYINSSQSAHYNGLYEYESETNSQWISVFEDNYNGFSIPYYTDNAKHN